MDEEKKDPSGASSPGYNDSSDYDVDHSNDDTLNSSGHAQELARHFSVTSLAGLGITAGNVWPAAGGSILVALYNGGPPGVLYEFALVSCFYFLIAAGLAELASAVPSSSGVYQWASITPGPRWGRMVGFYAGYWNYLAWTFGAASMSFICSNTLVQMYALQHPSYTSQPWHVFVAYILTTWIATAVVCLFNSFMPYLTKIGIFFLLGGYFITVVVCAVMPTLNGRQGHASSSFVWRDWEAEGLGYPNGFVFVAGMLNGAYAMGTPDTVTHLAEEIPNPRRNIPLAILLQYAIGFFTGFTYLIALMYSISDYGALFDSAYPLAQIYRQVTGSATGAIGLLALALICITVSVVGATITAGRTLWTLGRDAATPFPHIIGRVDPRLGMPRNATLLTACLSTLIGIIYLGSATAFNAFVGSFICMTTSSYLAALLPHLLTGRRHIPVPGPFHMPGAAGIAVYTLACSYIMIWFVIYCFPYTLPTSAGTMNYTAVIWSGFTLMITVWWFIGAARYKGPPPITNWGPRPGEMEKGRRASATQNA